MEVLDINSFLSFKADNQVQELDSKTLELLNDLFGNDKNKKGKKFIKKPTVNILKNQKIQNKKENIINRVNLILNKLSESNIDSLIIEFVENVNQVDEEQYEEVQKAFYYKILSEINFIKVYLQFLKMISYIYNKVQSYDLSFFNSAIESKFRLDYTDYDIDPDNKFNFVKDLSGETKRINNLILIKNLIDFKLMSEKLNDECDKIIIEQNVFLPDIYYWFNSKNRELSESEKSKIKKYLQKDGIGSREIVLLESLLNKKLKVDNKDTTNDTINVTQVKVKPTETVKISTDTLKLEAENIIEEYLIIKSVDDVKYFVDTRCLDAITKNKFCEYLIYRYFQSNKEVAEELINLMKILIKNQTLYKSNLSRGLLMIYNNWKEKSIDYNKPTDKMKTLLTTLKNIGITKSIEFLMDQYKITIVV
jgi:hypothetical protein